MPTTNASPFSFRQHWDDRIEIIAPGAPSATYQFSSKLPKGCIHPLTTPQGHQIGGFEMSDHVWHRGLWFTIKFINGSNFWEERPPFGIQKSKTQPSCMLASPDSIRITHALDWTSEATGTVLTEIRTIIFRSHPTGIGTIDWHTEIHPTQDLLLDRTPYTTWGGYGGMSFRASRELHSGAYHLPNGENRPALIGERHDWVILESKVDSGIDQRVSLAMIDHPQNPRGQTPWYCKAQDNYTLMNAAFLFHEPMNVKKGEKLNFRYQILYRDGTWTTEEFAALAKIFRETPASSI